MQCKYCYKDIFFCNEDTFNNSDFCALHTKLDKNNLANNTSLLIEKQKKLDEKLQNKDFNFTGINVLDFKLYDYGINDDLILDDIEIIGIFEISNITFDNYDTKISLEDCRIEKTLFIKKSKIKEVYFKNSKIKEQISIMASSINYINIYNSNTEDFLFLNNTKVKCIMLRDSSIGGISFVDVSINNFFASVNNTITNKIIMENVEINDEFNFYACNLEAKIKFKNLIGKNLMIEKSNISNTISFEEVTFKRDIFFNNNQIDKEFYFHNFNIYGDFKIKKTKFIKPETQEKVYRFAKSICEKTGDHIAYDDYFYKEMDAKRKQYKNKIKRYLEYFFIQLGFSYGKSPFNVILIWISTVLTSSSFYYFLNGIEDSNNNIIKSVWNCLYFSIVTITTLGFGDLHPIGFCKVIASIEAIVGTFLWAAFITIFARKYMR